MADKYGNKTGGRQKGSLNIHTTAFKDLIIPVTFDSATSAMLIRFH